MVIAAGYRYLDTLICRKNYSSHYKQDRIERLTMPSYKEANFLGSVLQALIVPTGTDAKVTIVSEPLLERIEVTFEGLSGESHSGLTREACVRTREIYDKGTQIRNVRQITIISEEEMALIAKGMDIDFIKPEWLGANLLVSGIPNLTLLPPSTRLLFSGGVCLVIDMENLPCGYPAKEIQKAHEGKGKLFMRNAHQRRGVTAWVEKEGSVATGDSIRVFMPAQSTWPGEATDFA
ncbi:MAG: MOSC domain-containing protein YiiM [Parasphingorhabdus sp.]|jgi:MOSC domain-containing protein YiiM